MGRRKKRRKKIAQILPDLLRVYRYFKSDIRKKSRLIASSFSALLLGVFFRLLEPWPLKFVLDQVFPRETAAELNTISLPESWSVTSVILFVCVAIIVIATVRATTDYISRVGFFKVGNYVVIRVRDRVYRHLQALPMAFHDRAKHGDLITRVTRDVSLIRDVTATAILPLLGSSLVLVGMAGVMLWLNWKLALISLIVLPLYWLTTVRLGRRIKETARKQREREGAMATIASEAISSIRAIKALGLEQKFAADFDRKNNQSQTDDLKSSRLSVQLSRTVDILLAISTAAVMWFGADYVLSGKMLPGDLVVFLVYLKRSFKPAQEFAKYTARIAKATAAGERVINILEKKIERDSPDSVELTEVRGRIEFQNVSFGYDNEQLVLKEFDLTIEPGKTVAIVGASGVGKSTTLNLLLRLYEPNSGRILIDGHDIQECSLKSLRSTFSVVLQNPLLFAASIRENIAIGRGDSVSEKEIFEAAKLAEVDEFVLQLPRGMDTEVGERSTTLSRGQRQRIAIARAALACKSILLLDEATTGLDENNQAIVSQALLELASAKTTLMVTHNFEFARRADEIVFISTGRVVDQGTHESLLVKNGPYAKAFLQYEESKSNNPPTVSQRSSINRRGD